MSEPFDHDLGAAFKALPEVYQIELTNRCNLKCPMCLRTTDMGRDVGMLDLALLSTMHDRGDWSGTAYTELQMAGEPTMHPQLTEAIEYLRGTVGVLVGLSTHGLLVRKKERVLDALMLLDALTISVDSLDPATYHQMRYPATVDQLAEAVEMITGRARERLAAGQSIPFIELQLVRTPLAVGSGDLDGLLRVMAARGWDEVAEARVTGDCFVEAQGRRAAGDLDRNASLCVNPWSSVSVSCTGDVASCCYIFDPHREGPLAVNWYGNLYEQSLAEVWAGERVRAMRQSHLDRDLRGQCAQCYLKSPTLIHQNIVSRLVRLRRGAR